MRKFSLGAEAAVQPLSCGCLLRMKKRVGGTSLGAVSDIYSQGDGPQGIAEPSPFPYIASPSHNLLRGTTEHRERCSASGRVLR